MKYRDEVPAPRSESSRGGMRPGSLGCVFIGYARTVLALEGQGRLSDRYLAQANPQASEA